jgi:hypothetical protein
MGGYLIVVDTAVETGTDPGNVEEWYAGHAQQVSRIAGVTKVERYWSTADDGDGSHHLALYHVEDPPPVMAERFARAKADGRLTGAAFPSRTQHSYRLQSVVE